MKCEYDDFESQSAVKMCSNKNCQENINMQPVMPENNECAVTQTSSTI